jgi:hypothetical protein
MRRVLLMAVAVTMILGTASAAQAQIIEMAATLSGSNETPAPILNGSYGSARVTVDIGAQTVSWNIDVVNLPSGMTAGHFHVGGPGLSGPTVVNLIFPTSISNDFNLTGSANSATAGLRPDQGIRSWIDFLQALVGEQVYLNIHTQVNGGGEIRGQVRRILP